MSCHRPKLSFSLFISILAVSHFAGAQPSGTKLPPDRQEAAWTVEVLTLAKELKLTDEQTAKVAIAYKYHRKTFQEAVLKSVGKNPNDRTAAIQEITDLRYREVSEFELFLKSVLAEAEVKTAIASLGTFNGQWDNMVDVILGFKLDEQKQDDAMRLIKPYIEASSKAQDKAAEDMDIEALRSQMQKLKQKLEADLAPILSPAQMDEWKVKTAARRLTAAAPVTGAPQAAPPGEPKPPADPPKGSK